VAESRPWGSAKPAPTSTRVGPLPLFDAITEASLPTRCQRALKAVRELGPDRLDAFINAFRQKSSTAGGGDCLGGTNGVSLGYRNPAGSQSNIRQPQPPELKELVDAIATWAGVKYGEDPDLLASLGDVGSRLTSCWLGRGATAPHIDPADLCGCLNIVVVLFGGQSQLTVHAAAKPSSLSGADSKAVQRVKKLVRKHRLPVEPMCSPQYGPGTMVAGAFSSLPHGPTGWTPDNELGAGRFALTFYADRIFSTKYRETKYKGAGRHEPADMSGDWGDKDDRRWGVAS
jgi:hypothetical protein